MMQHVIHCIHRTTKHDFYKDIPPQKTDIALNGIQGVTNF
ncbi:hypothetical protein VCSRO179_3579 [Vibrio cholerae]|nr:hypothetical protein VCSRO179_3579 [Vibrio cholerae]